MHRNNVLYVTPIMPQRLGNGLAMRAASMLEALAHRFDVHLFVVPVAGDLGPPSDFVRAHTVRTGGLDLATNLDPLFALIARVLDPQQRAQAERAYPKPFLSRFCTGDSAHLLLEWSSAVPVGCVHVMRLYLAPLAQPFLRRPGSDRPFCVLDLDDDEVQTFERLARLYSDAGDQRAAAVEAAEARKYRAFADQFLPAFDRVIVCSKADASRLGRQCPGALFAAVPNCYAPLDVAVWHRPSNLGPLRLLLAGNFGYFPNADAALFLCREVLPRLRRLTDRDISVDLVGAGSKTALAYLAGNSGVRLRGFIEDLGPLYAAADVAVVPLRAGGGTRIKVLEAFAHRVPVVATSLGAEGIDAADGEELLLADDPEAFARACLGVKEQPDLAIRLSARAAALLAARYSPAQVDAAVAEAYGLPVVP
jgi:glycosyltransferase involved in cell wall biosynthesis